MPSITIRVFDEPCGAIAGFATLAASTGKNRRIAQAYLMADGSVDLSTVRSACVTEDGQQSRQSELATFERKIRETAWSNHQPEAI